MEIVIDPAQLWHQFISFANDYKLLTSLVLLIVLLFLKKGVLRLIRPLVSSWRRPPKPNQYPRAAGNVFIIIVLMMVWALKSKHWQSPLLPLWWQLCWQPARSGVLWGSFTVRARPFRVGDWIK